MTPKPYSRIFLTSLLLIQIIYICPLLFGQVESEVIVHEVFTSRDYNVTGRFPIEVSDYFDVTDSGVFFWVNMSYNPGLELSTVWIYPNSTIYHEITLDPSDVSMVEGNWSDVVFFLPIFEEAPSHVLGEWTVGLYQNEVLLADHRFNVIDKSGVFWNYFAEILSVESPETAQKNQNFTVSLEVHYNFENITIFTPGLWDTETGNLYNEANESVKGEGVKTYDIEIAVYDESGEITIEAAAFYFVDEEWFIDDEGLMSFDIFIEEEQGQSTLVYIGVLVLVILLAVVFLRNRIKPV